MTELSILQRFHETLGAMARDDIDAVQQLRASCPRVPELLPDSDYRDLVDGTEKWVVVVANDMLPLIARLEILQDLEPMLTQLMVNVSPRRHNRDHTIITHDFIRHVQAPLLGQLRAFWEALATVCSTLIEMDVRTVLQAEYPPLLDLATRFQSQWSAIDRNEEQYRLHLETLTALWLRFCVPPEALKH